MAEQIYKYKKPTTRQVEQYYVTDADLAAVAAKIAEIDQSIELELDDIDQALSENVVKNS